MSNDEILELAKKQGFVMAESRYPYTVVPVASSEQLIAIARAVREKTLEECALGCEEMHDQYYGLNSDKELDGYDLAKRIRRMK